MKKFLQDNWAIIGLILSFMVDNTFDILKDSGLTELYINMIKGLGVILVGYFWNPKLNVYQNDIAGGGPKNPPKP